MSIANRLFLAGGNFSYGAVVWLYEFIAGLLYTNPACKDDPNPVLQSNGRYAQTL
ncbi:MAG: hypothetical protein ABIT23_03415 [Nitrosospira sp.]